MEKEYEVMPMSLEQIKDIEQRLADIVKAYQSINSSENAIRNGEQK